MKLIYDAEDRYLDLAGRKGQMLLKMGQKHLNIPKLFVVCLESQKEITTCEAQIKEAFNALGTPRVAVRSSANVEDGERSSFAGQFETKLNVTENTLIEAIHYVYQSLESDRVASYAQGKNIDQDTIKMAVVIQQQIPSDVSGVCFSRYDHNEFLGVIEACWGMGEAIVSGQETPDRYMFERVAPHQIAEVKIGNQLFMIAPDREIDQREINTQWQDANRSRVAVPAHKRLRKKLSDDEIRQVAELALEIESEENYGCADIEFCFFDGRLFLLQARPGPCSVAVMA
jgi:pyruvate,water dikinase